MKEGKEGNKGNSGLHQAIMKENFREIKSYLERGEDPVSEDDKDACPFRTALTLQNPNILHLLGNSICHQFECHMSSLYPNLLNNSWIAYFCDGDQRETTFEDIRIVAILYPCQIASLPEKFKGILIHWRQRNNVSEEVKETAKFEVFEPCKQSISKMEMEWLFYSHTNLSIIHPSVYRSMNFRKVAKCRTTKNQLCIALYCQTKGFIPLGEKPFPKTISNLPTDVREGICRLAGGELGTAIVSRDSQYLYGTLGGFIENPILGFITAAHVMVSEDILEIPISQQKEILQSHSIFVYKESDINEHVGQVVCWSFEEGDESNSGVDAALVRLCGKEIDHDNNISSEDTKSWEKAGYRRGKLPRICSFNALSETDIDRCKGCRILKYGSSSKVTVGRLKGNEINVQFIDEPFNYKTKTKIMYRQMLVEGIAGEKFCSGGDSGAFCFMIDNEDPLKLWPFAMIIGYREKTGDAIITPLVSLINRLSNNTNIILASASQSNESSEENTGNMTKFFGEMMKHIDQHFETQEKKLKEEFESQEKAREQLNASVHQLTNKATSQDKLANQISERVDKISESLNNQEKRIKEIEKKVEK